MKQSVLAQIESAKASKRKLFALLLDPEKCVGELFDCVVKRINEALPDFIFVGGSQLQSDITDFVETLKARVSMPVVLFPGNVMQLTASADALLFLALLSGRNPEFLIGQQVKASQAIRHAGIETIPTAYLLIDGGRKSAVQTISQTDPIVYIEQAVATAIAGELLGHRLLYLEAGSGAGRPVARELIAAVRAQISIPLIVGGGLCNTLQIDDALTAGADVIVVGNYLEAHPEALTPFVRFVKNWGPGIK